MQRVFDAAKTLNYTLTPFNGGRVQIKPLRVVFLLPKGTNPYLKDLAKLITSGDSLSPAQNITCSYELVQGFDAAALALAISNCTGKYDGIAIMGLEHPFVSEAVNTASRKGTPVVTIITDLSHSARTAFIGLDNRAAGRTAAHLLASIANTGQGVIGLIAGSLSYRAHNDREMGFLSYMEENFPEFRVVEAREGHDDFAENYQLTKTLLAQHPKLVGIYNIGGSSGGVAAALRENGTGNNIVFIGHGLSDDTRVMLLDGTMDIVIHQDPVTMVHNTCQIFSNLALGAAPLAGIPQLSMQIICRENLP